MSGAGRSMRRRGPHVAIAAGRSPASRYSLHRGYVDVLAAIGAVPVVVPAGPGVPTEGALEVLAGCDALLLSGGGDVHPDHYHRPGGSPVDGAGAAFEDLDAARDEVELRLLASARAAGKRVLGICRGTQLVTVALGGTLITDLPSAGYEGHWREDAETQAGHPVEPDANSLAARALGGAAAVNSIHHQAVGDPGPQLRVTAYSADGVVEAVEGEELPGVQWPPERLAARDPRHLAALALLIRTASIGTKGKA